MQIAAILFAVGAAFAGWVGRRKAMPLAPAYAAKLRTVNLEVLEPTLWSLEALIRYLQAEVEARGHLPGTPAAPSLPLHNHLSTTAASLTKALKKVQDPGLQDFSEAMKRAGEANAWILGSLILTLASATSQFAVLFGPTVAASVLRLLQTVISK